MKNFQKTDGNKSVNQLNENVYSLTLSVIYQYGPYTLICRYKSMIYYLGRWL